MQYRTSITLCSTSINAITTNNPDRDTAIYQELERHLHSISSLLTSYHWEERGIVYGLTIDGNSINIDDNGNGKFRVLYGTNIHYGCSDKDIELDNTMQIDVVTDVNTGIALLIGENVPEREPDY